MRPSKTLFAILGLMIAAPAAARAQGFDGPERGADFLLAHTGELQLTDQQVVRLAGIARRTEARRRALRTSMDSMRTAMAARPDSARRRMAPSPMLQRNLEQMRDQARADVREAITVLTPEQQAQAWEFVSRGPVFGPRDGMAMGRGIRMPGGPRRPDGPAGGPGAPGARREE